MHKMRTKLRDWKIGKLLNLLSFEELHNVANLFNCCAVPSQSLFQDFISQMFFDSKVLDSYFKK